MKRGLVLGSAARDRRAGCRCSAAIRRRQAAAAATEVAEIEKVKDNLYMITVEPATATRSAAATPRCSSPTTASCVVDTKLAGWGQAILDKVKTVTDKPVTTIINTHTHGDHTGSNEFFRPTVDIVAQENTKANMEKMDAFKGDNAKFLPKQTFKDKLTLGSGKDQIDLYYFGRGHTNGDAWVVFPALRVMHTGDMFAWKDAPLVDANNGGSGVAVSPQTLAKALADHQERRHGDHRPQPAHDDPRICRSIAVHRPTSSPRREAAMKAGKSVDDAAAGIQSRRNTRATTISGDKAAVQVVVYKRVSQEAASARSAGMKM